ncbi:hypothetical protein Glove_329g41 [Diversispora epigaea]|uniref:Mitochondrial carrier protein n=1 Tax=Diversispora epigaea TaxID=1348612 RepID=A0A397HK87_9GLOM|nr:hypothetical protein Glove_329g41 [Diversispora epigaea]
MGLSQYVWHLALGQPIKSHNEETTNVGTTSVSERDDNENNDSAERVSDLMYDPNRAQSEGTLLHAQNQILRTIEKYKQPSPNRELVENLCGFSLAVTGLSSQYLFGYPLWTLRTRHQVFPFMYQNGFHDTPQQDTLLAYWNYLFHTGKRKGFEHLWNGFISKIACQTLMVLYESSLENIYDRITERQYEKSTRITTYIVLRGFDFILFTPLYPILRHSMIRKIDSRFDVQDPIVFYNNYKRTLMEIFSNKPSRNGLKWESTLVPAYCCHFLFETVQLATYQKLYEWLSPPLKPATKKETMLHEFYPELVCAIGSHLVAKFVIYPLETVVDRLMVQGYNIRGIRYPRYSGFWNCVSRMINEEGVGSFYNGLFGGFIGECLIGWISLETMYAAYLITTWAMEKLFSNNREQKRKIT